MKFDYKKKKWGTGEVDLNPQFLGATRLKYVLAALKEISRGKLLEIGCGGGAFSRAIKKHRPDLEIIGIDIIQEVLIDAKKKKSGVKYQQADVYHLPFQDESFQAVVSFDVWEHLDKPNEAFKEVMRVLKKGGTFHFFAPTEGNHFSLYQLLLRGKFYEIKKEYTGHLQAYTQEKLVSLLSKAGFKIKKVNFSCFYFYQLIDLSYFAFLKMRGRNAAISVEGYLQIAKGSLFDRFLGLAKTLFAWLTYFENEVFNFVPAGGGAGGIHITAVKKRHE